MQFQRGISYTGTLVALFMAVTWLVFKRSQFLMVNFWIGAWGASCRVRCA